MPKETVKVAEGVLEEAIRVIVEAAVRTAESHAKALYTGLTCMPEWKLLTVMASQLYTACREAYQNQVLIELERGNDFDYPGPEYEFTLQAGDTEPLRIRIRIREGEVRIQRNLEEDDIIVDWADPSFETRVISNITSAMGGALAPNWLKP